MEDFGCLGFSRDFYNDLVVISRNSGDVSHCSNSIYYTLGPPIKSMNCNDWLIDHSKTQWLNIEVMMPTTDPGVLEHNLPRQSWREHVVNDNLGPCRVGVASAEVDHWAGALIRHNACQLFSAQYGNIWRHYAVMGESSMFGWGQSTRTA